MKRRSSRRDGHPGLPGSYRAKLVAALLVLATLMLFAACSGETAGVGGEAESPDEEAASGEQANAPADATVGPDENSAMLPAGGKEKDSAQSPPGNPPEGVRTYPASTNNTVQGSITYEQDPPTNGDHSPMWQNCGFYGSPIANEYAVHSMDHGAVWITYQEDLPSDQVDDLRELAQQEEYVLVSPYPGLSSPVVATAWRNQLELTGADDARLQQFVDQFRRTETAPLSGNGCTDGVGEPEA